MKLPDLNELYYFAQVVEHGGFSAAERATDIPKSKLSRRVFNLEEREIPSSVIGEIVMDKLKDLEAVAYVRFASVYREFKDVNTFMDELKKILK